MSYLYIGKKGMPLKEIIEKLGNKNYDFIDFLRRRVDENGEEQNDYIGTCSYKDNVLTPLYGDSYSLDDLYAEWEETFSNDKVILTVWEYGENKMEYMRKEITFSDTTLIGVDQKAYTKRCELEDNGWFCHNSHPWRDGELYCITSRFIKPIWKEDKSKEDEMSKNYQKNIVVEWVKEIMNVAELAYDASDKYYKDEHLREIIGSCKAIITTLDCCDDKDS